MVIVVMFTNLANELGPHPAVINGRFPILQGDDPVSQVGDDPFTLRFVVIESLYLLG